MLSIGMPVPAMFLEKSMPLHGEPGIHAGAKKRPRGGADDAQEHAFHQEKTQDPPWLHAIDLRMPISRRRSRTTIMVTLQ